MQTFPKATCLNARLFRLLLALTLEMSGWSERRPPGLEQREFSYARRVDVLQFGVALGLVFG